MKYVSVLVIILLFATGLWISNNNASNTAEAIIKVCDARFDGNKERISDNANDGDDVNSHAECIKYAHRVADRDRKADFTKMVIVGAVVTFLYVARKKLVP